MTLRLGIIGLSPGNGHPYSWSAICNGYDLQGMERCGFPVISAYLAERSWPQDQLPGVRVTHVWTQDAEESARIARAAHIPNVVREPEDMIGRIDALLLARDDAQNHMRFAAPFLRAGLPVYIDKPVALTEQAFDALLAMQARPGLIFSCSALRFAPELQLDAETRVGLGPIRLIEARTPKYWQTYAIHLIDPILRILGHTARPERLFTGPVGADGRFLALRWPEGGPDVHLMATGATTPSGLSFMIKGDHGSTTLRFHDSFTAFRAALAEFVRGVHEGQARTSVDFNRRAVQIIEMGMP